MSRNSFCRPRIWALTVCLFAHMAQAVEYYDITQIPAVQNPLWLDGAVHLQITPRGQSVFSENLLQLISNFGFVVQENYFPEFEYISPTPLKIDQLAEQNPDQFLMVQKVRNFFSRYLRGISFQDFQPRLKIGESEYSAKFSKLSLMTDESLMKQLGKTEGAILTLEMSLLSLKTTTSEIEIADVANPWMGQITVKNPSLVLATEDAPLKIRVPFYVVMDPTGNLIFETLKIEENFDQVPLDLRYENLLLPQFEFRVSGQTQSYQVSLEETEFNSLIHEQLPNGIRLMKTFLRQYLQNEFPRLLNEKAREALREGLEQIQELPAAHGPENETRPPLSLGLKMTEFSLKDSLVKLRLKAFVEDSTPQQAPFWKGSEARGEPSFQHLALDRYDIGMSINRSLLNRFLQLSFNRKNFEALSTCPTAPAIRLLSPPSVDVFSVGDASSDPLEASLSLAINAQIPTPQEYSEGFLAPLKDKLHLRFFYQVKIRPVAQGSSQLGIFPVGIHMKSLQIDDDSLTWVGALAKGKVHERVSEALSQASSCGSSEPMAQFSLVNSLWGMPIQYAKMKMDGKGQLMLYMNFDKDKLK